MWSEISLLCIVTLLLRQEGEKFAGCGQPEFGDYTNLSPGSQVPADELICFSSTTDSISYYSKVSFRMTRYSEGISICDHYLDQGACIPFGTVQ